MRAAIKHATWADFCFNNTSTNAALLLLHPSLPSLPLSSLPLPAPLPSLPPGHPRRSCWPCFDQRNRPRRARRCSPGRRRRPAARSRPTLRRPPIRTSSAPCCTCSQLSFRRTPPLLRPTSCHQQRARSDRSANEGAANHIQSLAAAAEPLSLRIAAFEANWATEFACAPRVEAEGLPNVEQPLPQLRRSRSSRWPATNYSTATASVSPPGALKMEQYMQPIIEEGFGDPRRRGTSSVSPPGPEALAGASSSGA